MKKIILLLTLVSLFSCKVSEKPSSVATSAVATDKVSFYQMDTAGDQGYKLCGEIQPYAGGQSEFIDENEAPHILVSSNAQVVTQLKAIEKVTVACVHVQRAESVLVQTDDEGAHGISALRIYAFDTESP